MYFRVKVVFLIFFMSTLTMTSVGRSIGRSNPAFVEEDMPLHINISFEYSSPIFPEERLLTSEADGTFYVFKKFIGSSISANESEMTDKEAEVKDQSTVLTAIFAYAFIILVCLVLFFSTFM